MAWVTVPNSGGIWEYDNTAVVTDTYRDSADGANSVIANGVRTYTYPSDGRTVKVYIRTRKAGETKERGELSKTYYDNQ